MNELKLPLTNIQMELFKLFAIDMSEKDLFKLKELLANFFAKKAIESANELWNKRGLTDNDMDLWHNEKS